MNIDTFSVDSLSVSSDNLEILFLDTFSSQSIEDRAPDDVNKREFNVGLIQFSSPVIIHELRIIPLSTVVSAESLRGLRLGATIPSSFDVHFYVNDLKAKEAPTFLDLGSFTYKEHENIIFRPVLHVPTDGLFLRGQFESLTIAVLGVVTDISSLVSKKSVEQPQTSEFPDEIKELDDDNTNSNRDKSIEIKEPDESDDFNHQCLKANDNKLISNNSIDCCDHIKASCSNPHFEQYVIEDEELHSPSPDNFARIRSPSPHTNLSTPKSNESNLSEHIGSKEKIKEYLNDSKYSPSRSSSRSPVSASIRLSHRETVSPKSLSRRHQPSLERGELTDKNRSSSSHHLDRYNDDNRSNSRHRSKHSRDRTPEASHLRSSSSRYYASGSSHHHHSSRSRDVRSRSRSRDSSYGHTQHLRSLEKSRHFTQLSRSSSRDRCRSTSYDRNHDSRSMHNNSREDRRSISRSNSRTKYHEPNSADSHRGDMSPKSSTSSKHNYTPSHQMARVRLRSRSSSPSRKRKYHHLPRDSHSPSPRYTHSTHSPDSKRSRYYRQQLASPTSPSLSLDHRRDDSIRSISPSPSPKVSLKSSEANVGIVKTFEPQTIDLSDVVDTSTSPLMSPNSSISNFSLKSADELNSVPEAFDERAKSGEDEPVMIANGTVVDYEGENHSIKSEIELFEPLSPMDEISDIEEVDAGSPINRSNHQPNYEEIGLSSDEDTEKDVESEIVSDTKACVSRKGELLEVISSDEEYTDELNAALSSEKIDAAKNYIDISANKFEDDEVESSFDFDNCLFDPFAFNQLKPLSFAFNCNEASTFIDEKLFRIIVKIVEDKFSKIYSSEDTNESERQNMINELWVKDVELLSCEIMKLTSPIYCSFDDESSSSIYCEKDFERFTAMLIAITKDGLNFELAISQKQAFKVRHLKAGIKLFIALFSSMDLRSKRANLKMSTMLLNANLPHYLLLLFNKPHMTLSLRLLILNGLIVLCDRPEGVEYLCNQKLDWPNMESEIACDEQDEGSENENDTQRISQLTMYQYVLMLILRKQKSRLTSVFEELLDKIHLFELFNSLSRFSVHDLTQMCNSVDDDLQSSAFDAHKNGQNIFAMLSQLVSSFSRLSNRIHRPLRLLPNICQYEIKTAVHTSTPLLLLATTAISSAKDSDDSSELFNFIRARFACRHISCSSSKIGFFSQKAFYRYMKHFQSLQLFVDIFSATIEQLQTATPSKTPLSKSHQNVASTNQYSHICEIVVSLLDIITSHQQGLKFLLADEQNTNITNTIHQHLIKCRQFEQKNVAVKRLLNFGVKFVTRLHSFNLVDEILQNAFLAHQESAKEIACSQNRKLPTSSFRKNDALIPINQLFQLYSMVYLDRAAFRDSVISILTMEHNFDAITIFLFPLTVKSGTQSLMAMLHEKTSSLNSISFVYAAKLIIACIEYLPEKNFIHFYDSYGQSLQHSIETVLSVTQNSSIKLHKSDISQNHLLKFASLANWLSPLKRGNFNSHEELSIRTYVTILKKQNDACREVFSSIDNYVNRVFNFEPEIITAIKVLVSLCDPTSDYAKNQDPDIQLKYKSSLLHCNSYDCVSYLLTLLEAVSETCIRPSHQTFTYSLNDSYNSFFWKSFCKSRYSTVSPLKQHSLQQCASSFLQQGSLILEFIRPSVRLLKLILSYILSAVGSKFNDSTSIPILLKIYYFLNFYHLSVMKIPRLPQIEFLTSENAAAIQEEIIDIILTVFTCVFVEHSESEEALKQSVWTKMLRHVIEFTVSLPRHFCTGLEILSKCLPLTLPIVTNNPISDIEMTNLINFRKLWSAHLHVLQSEIQEMINLLLLCDSSNVQQNLRNVCYKLCDLYTPTVTFLTRSLTELLVHHFNACLQLEPILANDHLQRCHLKNCLKILNLILDLFACNVAFRIGILHAFYFFSNFDVGRKDSSKIYQLLGRLFEWFNQRKFNHFNDNLPSASNLLKVALFEDQLIGDSSKYDLSFLFTKYFSTNRDAISSNDFYKFPDKLASKFISVTSESLNDYFNKRSPYIPLKSCSDESVQEDGNISAGGETSDECLDVLTECKGEIQIYSAKFITLFAAVNLHTCGWPTRVDLTEDLSSRSCVFINFFEIAKKYFSKDGDSLSKIFETLYSPVVETPELQPEKPVEDVNKISVPSISSKRLSTRGRGRPIFGRLNDHFRSRPPNTSRPPSMHVDDFVALELRQDTGKSRSSHLHVNSSLNHSSSNVIGNNSSYGSGKHQDFIRKKNISSHSLHAHPHIGLYSNNLKMNSNSPTNNYNKPP